MIQRYMNLSSLRFAWSVTEEVAQLVELTMLAIISFCLVVISHNAPFPFPPITNRCLCATWVGSPVRNRNGKGISLDKLNRERNKVSGV